MNKRKGMNERWKMKNKSRYESDEYGVTKSGLRYFENQRNSMMQDLWAIRNASPLRVPEGLTVKQFLEIQINGAESRDR